MPEDEPTQQEVDDVRAAQQEWDDDYQLYAQLVDEYEGGADGP